MFNMLRNSIPLLSGMVQEDANDYISLHFIKYHLLRTSQAETQGQGMIHD